MSNQKGRVKPRSVDDHFALRAATIRGASDAEQRAVPITLATETPVKVFDGRSGRVMDEILLMDGLSIPRQLPLLDSHSRYSTRQVIGSIRELNKTKDGRLDATAYFASNRAGGEAYQLIEEGHLTDFSIGFRADEVLSVRADETRTVNGRSFTGPVRVIRRSQAFEGSVVAIGADSEAKVRDDFSLRSYLDPYQLLEEYEMDKLRNLLLKQGMPDDIDEAEMLDWLDRHLGDIKSRDDLDAIRQEIRNVKVPIVINQPKAEKPDDGERQRGRQEREAQLTKTVKFLKTARKYGVTEDEIETWSREGLSEDEMSRRILERDQLGEPLGLRAVESETDKFLEGVHDAMIMRSLITANKHPERGLKNASGVYVDSSGGEWQTNHRDPAAIQRNTEMLERFKKPSPYSKDFTYASLLEIATLFVERSGQSVRGLPRQDIVRRAFAMQPLTARASEPSYHSTGSFANLMLDALNKTLLMAYDEASVTYPLWTRQAASARDYKQLNRIRFGEMPDPEVVPENHVYPDKSVSDARESYRVEKHGQIFSISMEAVINDDLDAIARIPALHGNAMRRKINKTVYAVLTDNAALSDGIALFHATSHNANLDAVALATAAISTGFIVMMTQTGLSGTGTYLNIMPRYLIVPPSLSATALTIVNSTADPTQTSASTEDASRPGYNAGTANIYGPGGPRRLVPIIEAQLEATSTTGWYMAADTSQIDTVEITFLQGEESPAISREETFDTDSLRWKVRQSFAAKAIDYRGLYQGNS